MKRLRQYLGNTSGSTTVEAVIWFPIYITIIGLIFDSTMLMMSQAEMWTLANDTSRLVALGRMSKEEAEEYLEDTVSQGRGLTATVSTSGNIVTTEILRPFRAVPSIGIVTSNSASLQAVSYYRFETPGAI